MTTGQAKVILSNAQLFIIVIASTTAFGHFVYVHLAILFAGRNAWICLLMASAIGVGIMYVHVRVALVPGKSLVEYAMMVFGKWLGRLVSLIYVSFFLLVIAITVKVVADFMGVVYPTTPPSVFVMTMFAIAAWVVYSGIEVMGRTMQILLPLMMILGISASLLSMPDKDFTQIYPILNEDMMTLAKGTLVFVAMYSELIGFAMVTDHAKNPKKMPKQILWLGCILVAMFLSPVTGPIMVFGESLAKNLTFPTYTEIQYIHVGNVIERLDIIGVLLWTIGSFFRISMFMFAAVKGMAQLSGSKRETTYLIPMTLLAVGLSLSMMQSSREEIYHILGSTYLFIAPAVGVGLPLLTGLVALFRRRLNLAGKKPQHAR